MIRAAGLGALGGLIGRQIGLRNGLSVARSGQGVRRLRGKNAAVVSGAYAQVVGESIASGIISATGM